MASAPKPPFLVKALYPYQSEHEDDLTFEAGQTIKVEVIEDDEWFTGSLAEGPAKSGMFPRNFVEIIPQPAVPASRPPRSAEHTAAPAATKEPESAPVAVAETKPVTVAKPSAPKPADDDDDDDWGDGDEDEPEKDMKSIKLGAPKESNETEVDKPLGDLSLEEKEHATTQNLPIESGVGAGAGSGTEIAAGTAVGTGAGTRADAGPGAGSVAETSGARQSGSVSGSSKAGDSSFKSRIAAFNTQKDAPPTPLSQQPKPTSFARKPFIGAPSSYVPSVPPSGGHAKSAHAPPPPVNHEGKFWNWLPIQSSTEKAKGATGICR